VFSFSRRCQPFSWSSSAFRLSGREYARAGSVSATINLIDANGVGAAIGTVTFKDAEKGLLIIPALSGLPRGAHGFHIHEKGACEPGEQNGIKVAGTAAVGHYDPQHTSKHLGPYHSGGHAGDLPELVGPQTARGCDPSWHRISQSATFGAAQS
jgi:Cu/Zn superoxide dismutase